MLTGHNCNFRHMLLEDLKRSGIAPRVALETSSKEVLKQFAINQLGVAFMPEMAARSEVKAKKLKRLSWKGADFEIYSQLIVCKDKRIGAPIEAFEKMLMEEGSD